MRKNKSSSIKKKYNKLVKPISGQPGYPSKLTNQVDLMKRKNKNKLILKLNSKSY